MTGARVYAAALFGVILVGGQGPAHAQEPPPVPVEVARVVERTVEREIPTVGTVEANRYTTVSAEVAGAVAQFDLREGDRVKKGTVIARLRRTDLEIGLKEAEANLREKQALFARADQDYQRFRALFEEGAVSVSELDQVGASARAAEAQKESAEEAFRRVADQLRRMTVVAPFGGYIVKKHVEVGQWVEEGGNVADLVDIDIVYVVIPVNEREIGRVRLGDGASVTVDTYPGRTFKGTTAYIIPQADPDSRNFPVKIRVDNSKERLLKAGMFARVRIRSGEPRQALFIPKDAVVVRGREQLVFVLDTTRVHARRVETGQALEDLVEVVRGELKPGQEVVVTGNEILRDGAPVAVRRQGEGER